MPKDVKTVAPFDEAWLLEQAEYIASATNGVCVYQILSEIRNESKLQQILESPRFDRRILAVIIEQSFDCMVKRFKQDCFQHNPHMNYLKIPMVMRMAIDTLLSYVESFGLPTDDEPMVNIEHIAVGLTAMLRGIERTETECLMYVEAQFVEKFIEKNFLRPTDYEKLVQFVCACLHRITNILNASNRLNELQNICECIDAVLRQRHVVAEINNNLAKFDSLTHLLVPVVYETLKNFLVSTTFLQTYSIENLMEQLRQRSRCENADVELKYAKAIFIGKFIECCYSVGEDDTSTVFTSSAHHLVIFKVS